MVRFRTTIRKFGKQGEKTGWTYIEIPADIADKLKPGNKRSFRVKGTLDKYKIKGIALIPMGGGSFILTMNADLRKGTGKKQGAMIDVGLEEDLEGFHFNNDFMTCLSDDPQAEAYFKSLTGSHQRYFSKWIDQAKTEETKIKRIAQAVTALGKKQGYPEMLRANKKIL